MKSRDRFTQDGHALMRQQMLTDLAIMREINMHQAEVLRHMAEMDRDHFIRERMAHFNHPDHTRKRRF